MKTYRELYFKGTEEQLLKFVNEIKNYLKGDWKIEEKSERWKDYLFIDYVGKSVDKGRVSIYLGNPLVPNNEISKGEIRVGNIVPLEKNELTVDEYNAILMKFYDDVINSYKESGTELRISQPTDDIFDPTTVISEIALKKLTLFCNAANKSTGSAHPSDQERWFDFVCQTVDDGRMFDYSNLVSFLQDEVYWGTKG